VPEVLYITGIAGSYAFRLQMFKEEDNLSRLLYFNMVEKIIFCDIDDSRL